MPPEKLQELYYYAWDTFYREESQGIKMFKLFKKVIEKEKATRPSARGKESWPFVNSATGKKK